MAKTEDRAAAAPAPPGEVTRLLLAWRQGDRNALDRLIPLVYGGTASNGRALSPAGAAGPHPSADGDRQRGVHEADRPAGRGLAGSGAFFRRGGPVDAADPGGARASPGREEAGRRRNSLPSRNRRPDRAASSRPDRPGRRARQAHGARRRAGPGRRAAFLRGPDRRRDRGSPFRVLEDHQAQVACGQDVSLPRAFRLLRDDAGALASGAGGFSRGDGAGGGIAGGISRRGVSG